MPLPLGFIAVDVARIQLVNQSTPCPSLPSFLPPSVPSSSEPFALTTNNRRGKQAYYALENSSTIWWQQFLCIFPFTYPFSFHSLLTSFLLFPFFSKMSLPKVIETVLRTCSIHTQKKQFTQRSKQLNVFPVGGASGRGLFKAAWVI